MRHHAHIRRLSLVSWAALSLLFVAGGGAAAANLIADAGFEGAVSAGALAAGWTSAGTPPGAR